MRRAARTPSLEQDRSNVALYHDQLAELERDRSQGVISAAQFEQARTELGRRLLADVAGQDPAAAPATASGAWRFAALACVPIVAVAGYLALGTPQALDPALASAGGDHGQKLASLVEQLRVRVESDPADAEAAVLLARSLQLLGRAPEAAKAFAHAIELVPDAPQLYADYADVLVAAAEGRWTPKASAAVAKALELDPDHPKSLWLAGTEAYARKDYRTALARWEKLVPMTEPGSEVARIVNDNIAEVRSLIAAEPGAAASRADAGPSEGASGAKPASSTGVSGTVSLDPQLASEVKPDDTVFVFARAASGPRMPLAIRRIRVQDLPYRFALGESDAMAAGMTISAYPQVVIGARVSRSGDAMPRPGDLEGSSAPVKPGAEGVEVRIDARVR